jgi:hypothetical protein
MGSIGAIMEPFSRVRKSKLKTAGSLEKLNAN